MIGSLTRQSLTRARLLARPGATLVTALAVRLALLAWAFTHLPWATTDVAGYTHMVQQSDAGFYPFVHFWMEYPPIFPLLAVALYRMLALLPVPDAAAAFVTCLALVMSGVDLANVVLVHRLSLRARGPAAAGAAALIYAACPVPMWFALGWFDALAVLTLLGGLLLLLNGRAVPAAIVVALGTLTKLFPIVLLLVVPAALGRRGTARFVVALVATGLALLVPLAVTRVDLLLASFESFLTRPPWETVPALLLRSYSFPILVPIEDRFTAATAVLPVSRWSALALVPQAVLSLAVWAAWRLGRARRPQPLDVCVLATLGVATLLLGSRGFSPQFVVWLLPLLVVVWPNRVGLAYAALLSAHCLVYYLAVAPAIAGYYAFHTVPLGWVAEVSWLSVASRTLLLVAVVAHLVVLVRGHVARRNPPSSLAWPAPDDGVPVPAGGS